MLQAQQKALEEDELSQRCVVARILQKYVRQKRHSDILSVEEEDTAEWGRLRWDSVAATSTYSIIHSVFPGQHNINPGWLWNNQRWSTD